MTNSRGAALHTSPAASRHILGSPRTDLDLDGLLSVCPPPFGGWSVAANSGVPMLWGFSQLRLGERRYCHVPGRGVSVLAPDVEMLAQPAPSVRTWRRRGTQAVAKWKRLCKKLPVCMASTLRRSIRMGEVTSMCLRISNTLSGEEGGDDAMVRHPLQGDVRRFFSPRRCKSP